MHALNPSVACAWYKLSNLFFYLPQGTCVVSLILGSVLKVKVQFGAFLIC